MEEYEGDQLNFCNESKSNYFIYKEDNDKDILENSFGNDVNNQDDNEGNQLSSVLHNNTDNNNNADDIFQNNLQYALPEQLEYKAQNLNDNNIFPTTQANALYYKPPTQRKPKSALIIKKSKTSTMTTATSKTKKGIKHLIPKGNVTKKQTASSNKKFTINNGLNPKGLFDPYMKVNELDIPKRTQKQRNDRIEKIKQYDVRYSKKIKKLDVYYSNFDAYEDFENRKNDIDFNRHKNLKESIKSRDEIRAIIDSIPKNKQMYHHDNLDFNFSKYEDKIEQLENEIQKERLLRHQSNLKYQKILMREKGEKSGHRSKSQKRICKTPMRISNRNKKKNIMKGINGRIGLNKSFSIGHSKKSTGNISAQTEKRIKMQAKKIASNFDQMIDKDIDAMSKQVLSIQKEIMDLNKKQSVNNHKNQQQAINAQNKEQIDIERIKQNKQKKNKDKVNKQISPQVPYQSNSNNDNKAALNNYIFFPNNAQTETEIANAVLTANTIQNNSSNINIKPKDKFALLGKVNQTIDNYTKDLPQLLDKVNQTIVELNQGPTASIFNPINSKIQLASKSTGKSIQLHIDNLIEGIIDDLTYELMQDLQLIESKAKDKSNKDSFVMFVSKYYSHLKHISAIEDDVASKLSSKRHPLTPYISINKERKEHCPNIIIPTPIDDNRMIINHKVIELQHNDEIHIKNNMNKRTYTALVHYQIINDCKQYVKEYTNFQKSNRNFVIPNEYALYDEFVEMEMKKILEEEIDKCIDQLADCVTDIFNKELNK